MYFLLNGFLNAGPRTDLVVFLQFQVLRSVTVLQLELTMPTGKVNCIERTAIKTLISVFSGIAEKG